MSLKQNKSQSVLQAPYFTGKGRLENKQKSWAAFSHIPFPGDDCKSHKGVHIQMGEIIIFHTFWVSPKKVIPQSVHSFYSIRKEVFNEKTNF